MRFRELRLLAFGPFTDTTLDFGAREEGMHVVYGLNEAGKSTSLRAITALLYGIPARTADAHVHDNKKLRVGAVIERGDGELIDVVRRKGNKRTLLDRADNPVDEGLMTRATCGVSHALFVTMFGLDHVTLREGAQALLRGDGDVGESLFDAGGARGIGQVLDELHEAAEGLYKSRGQAPKLNDLLRQLKDIKQSIFMKEMLPSAWLAQRDATEEARIEYDAQVARRQRLGAERHRLQRALRAFPQLARRRQIVQRIEALGHVPAIAPDAREKRVAAEEEQRLGARRAGELREEIAALSFERNELEVDEGLAMIDEEEIRDVRDRLGKHKKALVDLPRREATLAERRREAQALLEELGRDLSLDEVHQLRLDKPTRARLDALKNAHGRHVAERGAALRARDEAHARRVAARARTIGLPEARDVGTLRRVVARASREGDLEERASQLTLAATAVRDRMMALARRLGGQPEHGPPTRMQVAAARERDGEIALRVQEVGRVRAMTDARRAIVTTELGELRELGAPSPKELDRERERRDEQWGLIAARLGRGEPVDLGPFEAAARASDRVADRLWQQAERVAKRARLTAEESALEREVAALGEQARALEEEAAGAAAAWAEAWRGFDSPPATPNEADGWLDDHGMLVAAGVEVAGLERETAEVVRRLERHRRELAPWVGDEGDLRDMLDRAEALMAAEDERRHAWQRARDKLAELDEQIAVLERRYADEDAALAAWREAWRDAVAVLGLGEAATVDEVAAVEDVLVDLFGRVRDADDLARRIDGMRRDAAELEAVLAPMLRAFLPALVDEPVVRGAEALIERYAQTQTARARREKLDQKIAHKRAQLVEVEERIAETERVLGALTLAAGVGDVRALEQIEERSSELEGLRRGLRDTEDALFSEGSLDELDQLTRDLDVDATRERALELEDDYKQVIDRCEELANTIGANERGLADLERKEGAAGAAARREETLSSVVHHAERYVRLRLASVVLEREVERYRLENQGPILARAGEIFPRLTLGRYRSLSVGFDDRDEPLLRCTRADDTEVDVAHLSDGTRDQLYLALRLASLERYGERGELLPFVIDDVLIHFDDERAHAALTVLAELAQKTQVLFFTHHARLVELTRDIEGVRHHALG